MTFEGGVPLRGASLAELAAAYGGSLGSSPSPPTRVGRFSPIGTAGEGDLAPVLQARFVPEAVKAASRGAALLVDAALAHDPRLQGLSPWVHPHATWAMACVLEERGTTRTAGTAVPSSTRIGEHAVVRPGVVLGADVTIGPGSVIGEPGFGWATGPGGRVRRVPHLAGVVIEDGVTIGALCTVDAGVLSPTVIRRGAHLDAHVHVGHNCEIGEGTFVAAQAGFAGSVRVGRAVLVGGQAGIADHVTIGDGARIAAKAGVIGDVAPGETVAGYPAVPRSRWLRGLAALYRGRRRLR